MLLFVGFILAEEDKTTQQSITLWFKCLDLHDRHYLTPEDLSYWYHEMANKMSVNMNHIIPFEYAFAQLYVLSLSPLFSLSLSLSFTYRWWSSSIRVDMIHPQEPNKITLTDIKRSGVASPFFNMLFSWQRFLDDERHHPLKIFSSTHKHHHKYHSYVLHDTLFSLNFMIVFFELGWIDLMIVMIKGLVSLRFQTVENRPYDSSTT